MSSSPILHPQLTHMSSWMIPGDWKVTIVLLTFKKGKNYDPIIKDQFPWPEFHARSWNILSSAPSQNTLTPAAPCVPNNTTFTSTDLTSNHCWNSFRKCLHRWSEDIYCYFSQTLQRHLTESISFLLFTHIHNGIGGRLNHRTTRFFNNRKQEMLAHGARSDHT